MGPLAKLIFDQCEFANIIILNKCDLIDKDKLNKIKQLISMINPNAKIIETKYSQIPLENIFNTKLYEKELNNFMEKPAWREELDIGLEHESETEKYGISSFGFSNNDRPFHPERLHETFKNGGNIFEGVLRGKGYFWIANDFDARFDFNIAGPMFSIIVNTVWLEPAMRNLMNPSYFKQYLEQNKDGDIEEIKENRRVLLNDMKQRYQMLMSDGNERRFGDRRIEMVFIGESVKMQDALIKESLNKCLLNDEELSKGPRYWTEAYQDIWKSVPRCIVI